MKAHITNKYKFALMLASPGCHCWNAAKCISRSSSIFSTKPLGQTPHTNIDHSQPTATNKCLTNSLCMCSSEQPFNNNKMPLAPMGCEVQVHQKEDNRDTWDYHSHTKGERLFDTVQFQHKSITNPTILKGDKLMVALANCIEIHKDHLKGEHGQQIREFKQLVDKAL
ncbi:hypothetical protein ACHAW6_000762 [Cyclotella cf. meneghiniana]